MKALFRHSRPTNFSELAATLFCLCLLLIGTAKAEWGGSVSAAASNSDVEGARSRALDQSYSLYTTREVSWATHYTLSGLFRHVQSQLGNDPYSWRTEVRPSGSLSWRPGILDFRGDASYRADRDEQGTSKLSSRTAGLYGQTTWESLPRLFGSVNWSKNVNDLELAGYDTRSRQASTGLTHSTRSVFLNYEFSDLRTRNAETGIDRVSQSHNGNIDVTRSLIKRAVTVQSSYQIVSRKERDLSQITGEVLAPLTATGLYLEDLSPEFEALSVSAGLSDGILTLPADEGLDLGNGRAHNFGLDFGVAVTVDHLHLYVDTTGIVPFEWTLWTSSDNLTWTQSGNMLQGNFSSQFQRLEFSFAPQQARYLKLAMAPQFLNTPIEVTELRGLVVRPEDDNRDRTTDHRGSAQLHVSPSKWLNFDVSGDVLRQEGSLLVLARHEDGWQSSLRIGRTERTDLSARYQWNRTSFTELDTSDNKTTSAGIVLRSRWNPALSTSASIGRAEEFQGSSQIRRNDNARFDVTARLFPALRMTSQLGYGEDSRFETDDIVLSRTVTTGFDGEPTNRSQISLTHRYETFSARVTAVRKYRTSLSARLGYRLTDTVQFTGSVAASEDPQRRDRTYDGYVSWLPTPKISLGASVNRIEGNITPWSNQYSLQGTYYWSPRTELSVSYALNERESEANASTGRVSLYSRF